MTEIIVRDETSRDADTITDFQRWQADWLAIGWENPWIRESWDPPFDKESFCECTSIEELKERLDHGNWCLGQAFTYRSLCFINQINGGDEWLTIKEDVAFESITFRLIIKRGEFEKLIGRLLEATLEQCIRLEY